MDRSYTMKKELLQVIQIAEKAWEIALGFQKRWFEVKEKTSSLDLVTEADTFLDKYIREELQRITPNILIWSEENECIPDDLSGDVWMVDPIDGTYDFVHWWDWWSVLIGLSRNWIPHAGVVHVPTTWETYAAISWQWYICENMWDSCCHYSTSDCKDILDARIQYSLQSDAILSLSQKKALWQICKEHTSVKSVYFVNILLWNAEWCFFSRKDCWPWDTCAPAVILQEAGGMITNLEWEPFDFTVHNTFWFIGSNWKIHNQLVEGIWKIL